jgi:hypothetical protein
MHDVDWPLHTQYSATQMGCSTFVAQISPVFETGSLGTTWLIGNHFIHISSAHDNNNKSAHDDDDLISSQLKYIIIIIIIIIIISSQLKNAQHHENRPNIQSCLKSLTGRRMCVIVANIMERCSLFLLPQGGAGPMALMLWLDLVIW